MKKNWKETLKLWLGALLLLAESAAIVCKKLPKKAVALCVVAVLVVAMVPVAVGAAEITNYDIWVEGTQVTSENQSNVLGKTGWSGATVTYDPTTNTLTLNYAALKSSNGTYNFGSRYVIYFGANAPANPILMVNGICSIVAESSDNTIIGIGASHVNLTIQKANSSSTLGIQVESTKEYNHGSSAYGIEAGNQLIFDGANVSVVTNGTARLTSGIFVMNYNSPVVTVKNSAYLNLSASGTATNNYALNYNAGGTLTIDDTSTAIFQSDDADCISTGISLNKDSEGNYTQIILADANKDDVMETHTSKPRNPYASRIEVHPAVKVTLDLSSAGGTSQELYWAKGVKFPEPSAPSIKGYVFEGWYTSSNYTTAFNFNQNLNTNTTIYAKFVSYESDKKELSDAIDDLQTAMTNLETALDNKVSTSDLTTAVNNLNSAIADAKAYADTQDAALKNALEAADTTINTAINELKDRVSALESGLTTANGKINTNASDIGTLKNDVAIIQTWKTEAQDAIDALETLTGTQGTNISALQTAVADLQTAVSTANSKIAAAEARIAALEGKVTSLETATTNLQTAVTALQTAVADKADAATVNAAIANLQTAIDVLEAVKDDYATADTALKAELEGKISAAQTAAISAAETLVNNAKVELQSKIDAKADAVTTTVAIQNLQAAVAALESVKDDYATADAALKTELEGKISAAQTAAISAAETLVNNAKAELQSKIDAKADAATTTVAIQNLQAAVAALESVKDDYVAADAALKTELESKISAAQTAAISAAETLVNNAKAELTAAINNKADTATLNQKVTDLIAAIAAAEDAAKTYADGKDTALQTQLTAAIATAKGEAITAAENLVNTAKAELQTAINNKADIATLNAKVAELNAAIATAEATAKAYTDSAVTTLNAAIITAKDEAVDAAKDLVDAAKAQLQAAIDNKADTAAVNAAIANLQNAITALQNAKDNYIAADAALKAELEAAIAKAKQEAIAAAKGHIPYIGTNGNWWIGDTDTGVDANGIKGDTGNGIASITTKKENGVTTVTITFTDPEKEPVVFTISDGETGATGADGVGVAKVEKTATNGNVDTYTITLTNGKTYTFTVTNGKDGANGKGGENGKDGADGKDGLTPFIGENGNWWIGENDTGVKAAADDSVPVGSGNVTEAEGVNTVTVVAIVIAGVALLGNVLLAVLVLKKKKSLV